MEAEFNFFQAWREYNSKPGFIKGVDLGDNKIFFFKKDFYKHFCELMTKRDLLIKLDGELFWQTKYHLQTKIYNLVLLI